MKKWAVITFISFSCIGFIWWYNVSPLNGGIYPEKQVGLELVKVEKDNLLVSINVPVRWIKTFPWEKPPTINELSLVDENGDIFSAIGGEYQLQIPDNYKWYEKNVYAQVPLYLNGASFAEEGSIATTAIGERLNEEYVIDQILISVKNKPTTFSVNNNYKYQVHNNYEQEQDWRMEGLMYFYGDFETPKGFIVRLEGKAGHTMEEVGFWLPGMPDNYYGEEVLYSYIDDLDYYNNTATEFVGETLHLPHTVENDSIALYFPFTSEMVEASKNSLVRIMPFYYLKNETGKQYLIDGSGTIGPIDRNLSVNELIYKPTKH